MGDRKTEYQIADCTGFRKFLDIRCVDDVPVGKTVRKYREVLTKGGFLMFSLLSFRILPSRCAASRF